MTRISRARRANASRVFAPHDKHDPRCHAHPRATRPPPVALHKTRRTTLLQHSTAKNRHKFKNGHTLHSFLCVCALSRAKREITPNYAGYFLGQKYAGPKALNNMILTRFDVQMMFSDIVMTNLISNIDEFHCALRQCGSL